MIASTLYVRVVPQDKDRGYMLLAGFEPSVIQRTAAQYTTLAVPTRATLNDAIARMKKTYSAADVKDVTDPGIVKKLAKLFGENPMPASLAKKLAALPPTFDSLGIGQYLPTV